MTTLAVPASERITEKITPEEYLRREHLATSKHEYFEGEFIPVSGGTLDHNRIASDIHTALSVVLRTLNAEVLHSDQRVRVSANGPFFYPDVSVVVGTAEVDADNCLLNPTILVEVLSPSTKAFDRDEKFRAYRRLPSLRHYILVATDAVRAEHFERLPGGSWALVQEEEQLTGSLTFSDLDVTIPLAEIYRRVPSLPEETTS